MQFRNALIEIQNFIKALETFESRQQYFDYLKVADLLSTHMAKLLGNKKNLIHNIQPQTCNKPHSNSPKQKLVFIDNK